MPTVIDSLVVKLGLDATNFQKETGRAKDNTEEWKRAMLSAQSDMAKSIGAITDHLKSWGKESAHTIETEKTIWNNLRIDIRQTAQEAGRTGRELEASGARGASFFGQMKEQALGLIGVLVGATGLYEIVRGTTENMASLGREAANIGVDPQRLGAVSMALERFGASGTGTRQSIYGISQALENWKVTGQGDIIQWLNLIGATPQNSPFQILQDYIGFATTHKNDPQLVNLIGHHLGLDQGTINAALQLKSLAQYQRELNQAMRDAPTRQEVEQAQQLYAAWKSLEQAAVGVANAVTTDMSPALVGLLQWGTAEIHQHPKVAEDLVDLISGLTILSGIRVTASVMGLTGVASVIAGITASVERLMPLLPVLGMVGPSSDLDKAHQGKAISRAQATEEAWMRSHGTPPPQFADHWWMEHAPTSMGALPAADSNSSVGVISRYFLSQGYSPDQVAGILANIQAESSFNPYATNGTHFGLFQWDKTRQAQFARLFGHPMQQSTPMEQLRFAQWELTHTEKKAGVALRGAKTRYQSGAVMSLDYERPGGGAYAADYRGMLARQYHVAPAAVGHPVMHNETHIGAVHVHTKGTDARAIAHDLAREIVTQANRGLQ